MNRQQARPCMCARTKQTMRFCTRHRGKTPFACSLEPCADVRTTFLSQLNRDTGRRNKTTARVIVCSKRHVSARVIHSLYLNRCGALRPTVAEDYRIPEQQDAHVEKSRRLAFSFQDCFLGINSVNRSKTVDCPTVVENKERDRERICLRCLQKRPAVQTGENKTSRCVGPAHQQEDVFGPRTKLCTAKQAQREAVTTQGRERIRQFMFALQTQRKTFSHICMTCLQIDSVSHWTFDNIVFHGTRFSAH